MPGLNIMLPDFSKNRKRAMTCFFTVICLAIVCAFIFYCVKLLSQQTFYEGIFIDGISVGGMEKTKAAAILEQSYAKRYKNHTLILRHNESAWPLDLESISFAPMLNEVLEKAYEYGHKGNIFKRLHQIANLKFNNVNFTTRPGFDKGKLYKHLLKIKEKIDEKGINAWVSYEDGEIIINSEQSGKMLDIDKNIRHISDEIISGNISEINLKIDEVKPDITYEDINEINYVLSSFTTFFNPKDLNRTHNIKLACEKINGIILLPGSEFSMNEALGPRTVENGYKEARIVYKNEYIDGIGGGICQTTTTLYNSVLLAKLKVIERSHHSLPSLYVGLGQDATIAGDYIDFKFCNSREYPVCINAEVENNRMTIRILGRKESDDYEVKLVPVIIEEFEPEEDEIIIDNSVSDGEKIIEEKARKGFRVQLYRHIYNEAGDLIKKEFISDDIYKPVRAKVRVNEKYINIGVPLNKNVEQNIE